MALGRTKNSFDRMHGVYELMHASNACEQAIQPNRHTHTHTHTHTNQPTRQTSEEDAVKKETHQQVDQLTHIVTYDSKTAADGSKQYVYTFKLLLTHSRPPTCSSHMLVNQRKHSSVQSSSTRTQLFF